MIIAALTLCLGHLAEPDMDRLLYAIAQVESNCKDSAYNPTSGASGRYQIKPSTWKQRMDDVPFVQAHNPKLAKIAASWHIAWLVTRLERSHHDVTVYNLALAWRVGLSAMIHGRINADHRDYAQRVVNLFRDYDGP